MPASGIITGIPGKRCTSGTDPRHNGFDIARKSGGSILAAADGEVTQSRFSDSAGHMVWIDHSGGWSTRYFHLKEASTLRAGAKVKQGSKIGNMGTTGRSTGVHLHFEIRHNGNVVKDNKLFGNFPCDAEVKTGKTLDYTFADIAPDPSPKKRVPDMLIVLAGRSQYHLITGDRYIPITEKFADLARKAGVPFTGIPTTDHEVLTKALTSEG